jgi:hypothetical protein
MKKSQVFISCGQKSDREKNIGYELVKYFENKNFTAYFAEHIHNSKPLLQSILDSLKESDYFVAYNPYRGKRKDKDKKVNPGSIFIQQEVASAVTLGIESLYFYEKGVSKTIGMSGALHLNGIEIKNIVQLKNHLDILTAEWKNRSKNQLFLKFGNPSINVLNQYQILTNWWHITCLNGSKYKHAKNCMAYIERIKDLSINREIPIPFKCEIVWAGVGMHNISILSKFERDFDAIYTDLGTSLWHPQILQTSSVYRYPLLSDGHYSITYLVVSDNFPDARLRVVVELRNDTARLIRQSQL